MDTDKSERKYAPVRGKSNNMEQDAISGEPAGHIYAVPGSEDIEITGTNFALTETELPPSDVNISTDHVYAILENEGVQQWPPKVDASNVHAYAVLEKEDMQQPPEVGASPSHVYAVLEQDNIQMSEDAAENTLKDQQHNADITRSDISTPVDWMYAQVDKKKKRGRRALLKTTET